MICIVCLNMFVATTQYSLWSKIAFWNLHNKQLIYSNNWKRFEQIGTVDVSIVKSVWAECAWYQWLEGWYGWACFVSIDSSSIWLENLSEAQHVLFYTNFYWAKHACLKLWLSAIKRIFWIPVRNQFLCFLLHK